tara:strand:- start:180 stop:689 length:510 start_codon:yes stop_codon:yes gene_type:complete
MKSLSFMRHAESDYNYIVDSDFDRPIKKSGLKMTKICAEHFKKKNIRYDLLFCSPALRTKQTSSYFLTAMDLKTIKVVYDYNLYEGSSENFLLRVSNLKKYKDILVVTHEPQILFFKDFFLSKTDCWPNIKDLEIATSSVLSINFDINMWNEINESNAQSYKFLNPILL